MRSMTGVRHLAIVLLLITAPAEAVLIADSVADFSGAQGQGGWSYGFFDQGPDQSTPYTVGAFVEFDTFNANRWEASDAQVGADNNDFLNLDADGGHPNGIGPTPQDSIIWAVRRFTSSLDGVLQVSFDLHKENIFNDRGGGITGRIFVDGVEVFTQLIENLDGVGVQDMFLAAVSVGSVIDFAIDPSGLLPQVGSDGIFSARADGSILSARISVPVPEPGSLTLLGSALLGFGCSRRRAGTVSR